MLKATWDVIRRETNMDGSTKATCDNCDETVSNSRTKPQATKCAKHILKCEKTSLEVKRKMAKISNSEEVKELAIKLGVADDVGPNFIEIASPGSAVSQLTSATATAGGKRSVDESKSKPVKKQRRLDLWALRNARQNASWTRRMVRHLDAADG